jgi:GNAT superfamily N-acetyltransferase
VLTTIRPIQPDGDLAAFCALPGPAALAPDAVAASGADLHLLAAGPSGAGAAARCSLWWTSTPPSHTPGHRLGLIGHYAAMDADAGTAVLAHACALLAEHGCTLVVGPMDGDTAHRYRLLTERGDEPLFFLEPDNPDDWPAHWIAAGFTSLAQYYSALQPTLEHDDPRVPALAAAFEAEGVRIRPLELDHFDDELRRVYTVAAPSFLDNFLATPLDEAAFLAQYQPVRPFLEPELVLLAEGGDALLGFVFALPDWMEAQRGQPVTTVIVKTLAVLPEYAGRGLATLLSARLQERAVALGYTRAIHALMHEGNVSRHVSERFDGHIFRRYTLYARPLEPNADARP